MHACMHVDSSLYVYKHIYIYLHAYTYTCRDTNGLSGMNCVVFGARRSV